MDAAERDKLPLGFVSWHIYNSDPKAVQDTIEYVKGLLAKHPSLHSETILDEWNMALTVPPTDSRIQPAFIAETAWRMKESGLDYSCYYHIRDYQRGPRSLFPLHVIQRRIVHGQLVESNAAILRPIRLPECDATGLLLI